MSWENMKWPEKKMHSNETDREEVRQIQLDWDRLRGLSAAKQVWQEVMQLLLNGTYKWIGSGSVTENLCIDQHQFNFSGSMVVEETRVTENQYLKYPMLTCCYKDLSYCFPEKDD